jgi:tetratricopeptide (TPR) repeat protein
LFFVSQLSAQTLRQTEQAADSFLVQGNFYSAAKYYERVYFFSDKKKLARINAKLGEAHFGKGDFERAYRYFDAAQKLEHVDSLKSEWFLRKTASLIMQRKFKLAKLGILNYRGKMTPFQLKTLNFLKGTIYYGEEDFQKAKTYFSLCLQGDSIRANRLENILSKKNIMRPNPRTAYYLSMAMPGLGQIYAGDIKNGINSFLLNGTLIYLFGRDALRYGFWNSFVAFFPWIQRYYMGGYQRAEKIAVEQRRRKRARAYKQIHHLIFNELQPDEN